MHAYLHISASGQLHLLTGGRRTMALSFGLLLRGLRPEGIGRGLEALEAAVGTYLYTFLYVGIWIDAYKYTI